ncbi:sensor histidine kinase [Cryptosporangium aurantiacum]|uniref:histidine kinase n=1 Tax=Cryptosporangium aurantiacum TaxID=134849 RepID=A0A1M7PSH1_9ACTN|nr:histidine kinase [Cryptosporangium aurantiacum]SHN20340.1 Signal transduction histidine kinase [Cryptosporangium aurantiacum]
MSRWRGDRRVADGLLVLGCLFLTALAVKTPWSALPLPVIAVAGVAASVALWWRRRLPHVAAAAGAVGYALSGNIGPLLTGLYAAGAYAPRRHVGWLALVGWAGAAGWFWIDVGRLTLSDAVYAAIGVAVPVGVGIHVATRRVLQEAWRERAERADAERALRDEQARAAERTRIAREMHDVLAHKVSLIALHAGALELTADGGADRVREGAGVIRTTAREALHELRTVLEVLHADAEPFTDLGSLVADAARAGQHVMLDDTAGVLPAPSARVVHRVVQEGLTNARKHAPGAVVTVTVRRDEEGVRVTVANPASNGAPLDLPGSGSGLVGLRERVRLVGGALDAEPVDGGWELRAIVPWLDLPAEADAR